jgi:hypothetical protein
VKARVIKLSASCVTHDEASFTFSEGEHHTATIVLPALGSDSKGSADPPLLVQTEMIEGNHARVDRGR